MPVSIKHELLNWSWLNSCVNSRYYIVLIFKSFFDVAWCDIRHQGGQHTQCQGHGEHVKLSNRDK